MDYKIGLNRRTMDSMHFCNIGRLRHDEAVMRVHFCWSFRKISVISRLTFLEYMNRLHSKLCSNERKSKFVDPMVENSSSITRVLACSIPAS